MKKAIKKFLDSVFGNSFEKDQQVCLYQFTSTRDKLRTLSSRIESQEEETLNEIGELRQKHVNMVKLRLKNEAVINKIENILN